MIEFRNRMDRLKITIFLANSWNPGEAFMACIDLLTFENKKKLNCFGVQKYPRKNYENNIRGTKLHKWHENTDQWTFTIAFYDQILLSLIEF